MGSITTSKKVDKATGKAVTSYRAFIRRTVAGKSVSKSKVFATKTEAKDWLRENEGTTALAAIGAATGPTFKDVIESFVKAPPTKGTRFWHDAQLEFWRDELGAMKTGEITRGVINACKAKLLVKNAVRHTPAGPKDTGKPLSPASVNRYLATLSSVFNYALQREIVDSHPMKGGGVSKEKEPEGRRRILTPDEEQMLYTAADESKW